MSDYIKREEAIIAVTRAKLPDVTEDGVPIANGKRSVTDCVRRIKEIPAADALPALWTDEPISGTEFMTHNQGQSGFEIHFRTDDRAKYEAVQEECRRQIGHAKPAADVRPVVLCKDCKCYRQSSFVDKHMECARSGFPVHSVDFCSYGKKREES